jgi:N-methylhydantoinase B
MLAITQHSLRESLNQPYEYSLRFRPNSVNNSQRIGSIMTFIRLNNPVEALEYAYPFRISRYSLREGSGGRGRQQGGNGLLRSYEFLQPAELTVLSDRRVTKPYGLEGGAPGQPGRNRLKRNGIDQEVSGKCSFSVEAGDALIIETPGGGGYGTT